jgi:hypothetical protein
MFENHVPVFGYFPAHFVVNPEQLWDFTSGAT